MRERHEENERTAAKGKLTAEEISAICAEMADDRKAEDILQLKMAGISSVADYFVLCTGNSEPHLRAIAERIQRELRNRFAIRPLHVDGMTGSRWTIIDYGAVMVHIMTPETRELYQIESLWGDAPRSSDMKKVAEEAMKRFPNSKRD